MALSARPVATLRGLSATAGVELIQVKTDLTHRSGANAHTQLGANSFANPENALGRANGTDSNGQGNAVGARDYQMRLDYADFTGKDQLTITGAKLLFYVAQTGTLANNGGMSYLYGWSGQATTVAASFTADVEHRTVPYELDVFALGCNTWTLLSSLYSQVNQVLPLGRALVLARVDAVELEVTATRTDAL